MIRLMHRWPGLVLAVLLLVISLSGAALSVFPALESARAPAVPAGLTVADLAARVQASHPGLEQIKRSPSGQISAWWFDGNTPGSAIVDPATGRDIAKADPDPVRRWFTTLHRSLFLGDGGRLTAAVGALGMLVLAISGAVLVARRTGGWRRWFARLRGPSAGRWHTEIARVVVVGLMLSSATALWMAAETFDVIAIDAPGLDRPVLTDGFPAMAPASMAALRSVSVNDLRALSFPAPDDPRDMFTLQTDRGTGYVDPGTGTLVAWTDLNGWQRLSEVVNMLHTGQGASWLGLLLGVMALGVPVLAVTGALVWWAGYRARPRIKGNAPAAQAETIVLVGSEGGSTWGFAAALADALRAAGQQVHVAPMSGFAPARYRLARRYLVLAATYGDGAAPASAKGFLEKLQALDDAPAVPLAVLGFGDRSFPAFCAFAAQVDQYARNKHWPALLAFHTIDRQSPQEFNRWGKALGDVLGIELDIAYQPAAPTTRTLVLRQRRDYGDAVNVPMVILRFDMPQPSVWQRLTGSGFARFEAGDLLGVVPKGSSVPRLYSLASGSNDGFIEIVVRKHSGGLCSGQLAELEPGETVQAFLRGNPVFHAGSDRSPLILVGAGTGVGPLAGFIRANTSHRPMHLFFGLRRADSDFLYRDELENWQVEGRLDGLSLAFSRGEAPQYVQDVLRQQAPQLVDAIRQGGKVMVCGGRDMARGVAAALTDILGPLGLSPAMLKDRGRYVEDVY